MLHKFCNGKTIDVQPMTPEMEKYLNEHIQLIEDEDEPITEKEIDEGFVEVMEEQGGWFNEYLYLWRNKMKSKRQLYREYIREHVKNINAIWDKLKYLIPDGLDCYALEKKIKKHDKSKWSDEEFEGYRQWFYPEESEQKEPCLFQKAWNYHQKNNPHHWEYWILIDKHKLIPIAIPYVYMMEMLVDWSAMSLKFGDTPSEFYNKNSNDMILHDGTKEYIEKQLPMFDKIVVDIRSERGE